MNQEDCTDVVNALIEQVVVTAKTPVLEWTEEAAGLAKALSHATEAVGLR